MKLIFGWGKPRNPILGTVYAGIVEQIGSDVKNFKKDNYNSCIDRIYTLNEIVEAHRYVDTGKKKGMLS
ncbi:hypothetical protein GCM10027275_19910 [Rhabdobacter roseus]|uniref:Uncharacterized protein n=2 Tax=Rhabdobacter roseus TaxID=1655419 RepID=A0A840TW99_9BACT|nr:hypothetical protein [Rhabdobacter roseus]MBB5283919.1 hypothetical protein [Rhabdobacter roseus]